LELENERQTNPQTPIPNPRLRTCKNIQNFVKEGDAI